MTCFHSLKISLINHTCFMQDLLRNFCINRHLCLMNVLIPSDTKLSSFFVVSLSDKGEFSPSVSKSSLDTSFLSISIVTLTNHLLGLSMEYTTLDWNMQDLYPKAYSLESFRTTTVGNSLHFLLLSDSVNIFRRTHYWSQ